MKFRELATADVAGVPAWVLVVGFLALGLGVLWYQERSARGVRRRAESSSKKAAGGVAVLSSGVLYGLLGTARGLSGTLDVVGDFILEIPDVLAYVGTSSVGYFALKGDIPLSAVGFGVLAVVLGLLGVALDD